MREYYSADGEKRLWYEPDEIERLVEDELRRAGLMPTVSDPITDLDTFVETYLRCPLDQYRPLPDEVLGITEFAKGKQPSISLNRDLTGSALDDDEAPQGVRGRWRATLAHEACHVLLHRLLFEFDENQGELFPSPVQSERLLRCLKRDVGSNRGGSDWREVQANQGMAAMLMPRRVFTRIARREVGHLGLTRTELSTGSLAAMTLARQLSTVLNVSAQAASIRLGVTGFVVDSSVPSLISP